MLEELNHYDGGSLAASIERSKKQPFYVDNIHGLTNNIYNVFYRFRGEYAPIFKEIPLFEMPGATMSYAYYKFDTNLYDFGNVTKIISKVNRAGSILKLKNKTTPSVYPMLDEFGYTETKTNIFKSSWDFEYHIECVTGTVTSSTPLVTPVISNINNTNLKLL